MGKRGQEWCHKERKQGGGAVEDRHIWKGLVIKWTTQHGNVLVSCKEEMNGNETSVGMC